jgi:dihydrofolate reductase
MSLPCAVHDEDGIETMRKLSVFNQISLDGYFKSADGGSDWMHEGDEDPEYQEFIASNASGGGALVFGRKTYEMMVGFWPTPAAEKQFPMVAKQLNSLPKIVFSKTLKRASWNNTKLVKGDPAAEIRKMKSEPGEPMVILGSGILVSQLAQADLIDEYQLLLVPVVLGDGTTMFEGARRTLQLKLMKTRTFRNGRAFLVYEPRREGSRGQR